MSGLEMLYFCLPLPKRISMKTMKISIAALFFLLTSCPAFGQIIITPANLISDIFVQEGSQYLSEGGDTNISASLENLSGANVSWNFTGESYVPVSGGNMGPLVPYSSAFPLAMDSDFSSATYVSIDSIRLGLTKFEYYRIDSNGYWCLGGSQDSMGVPSEFERYFPPFEEIKFPLTYLSSWQSNSIFYNLKRGYSVFIGLHSVVDGYGILTLPSIPNQATLRIKSTNYGSGLNYGSSFGTIDTNNY